jgi:hypothetical protein
MQLFSKQSVSRPESRQIEPTDYTQRLAAVEDELHQAEAELEVAGKAVADYAATHKDLRVSIFGGSPAVQLGALTQDPERQLLESHRDRALQEFHAILRRRADLMTTLGLNR